MLGDFGTHDLRLPHGCQLPKPQWQVLAILEFGCHVHRHLDASLLHSPSRCPHARNHPAFSVRRRSCRRRIFCRHPFALQGLHRSARDPALCVALPGASAAIAAAEEAAARVAEELAHAAAEAAREEKEALEKRAKADPSDPEVMRQLAQAKRREQEKLDEKAAAKS